MSSSESELAELRERVAKLEARVEALTPHSPPSEAAAPQTPPPLPHSVSLQGSGRSGEGFGGSLGGGARKNKPGWNLSPTVWIAAAGAVIFLAGVVYGLKVSIERGWLAPPMRVFAGACSGLVLGWISTRLLQRENRALGVAVLLAGLGAWNAALFYGSHAQLAGLFSPWVGFGGTLLATLLAGVLGARVRCDGAMAVAVLAGLNALHSFSPSGDWAWLGFFYLLVLVAGQLAAYYLTQTGGQWAWSRFTGVVGGGLSAIILAACAQPGDFSLNFALSGLVWSGLLALVWLPSHKEVPRAPGAATVVVQISMAVTWFELWRRAHYQSVGFSLVLLILACVSLALLGPARRRVGHDRHDAPLLLLFTGFVFVGAAVALDWRWVSLAWGMVAALSARASFANTLAAKVNIRALRFAALATATAATVVWMVMFWCLFCCRSSPDRVFFNPVFIGGVLAALAWGQLAMAGTLRALAFVVLELLSVNLLALELARALPDVPVGGLRLPVGAFLATVVYAVAGASQWLVGIRRDHVPQGGRSLRLAGYCWLSAAALKLLLHDLAGADLLLRAVAALAVGAIFLGAALWANQYLKRNSAGDL